MLLLWRCRHKWVRSAVLSIADMRPWGHSIPNGPARVNLVVGVARAGRIRRCVQSCVQSCATAGESKSTVSWITSLWHGFMERYSFGGVKWVPQFVATHELLPTVTQSHSAIPEQGHSAVHSMSRLKALCMTAPSAAWLDRRPCHVRPLLPQLRFSKRVPASFLYSKGKWSASHVACQAHLLKCFVRAIWLSH